MKAFVLVLFLAPFLLTVDGLVQSSFRRNAIRRSQRLNTALPLPTQVFENAIRSTANPIAQQVKRLAFNWKGVIVMLAAIITRFQSKIKSEVRKAANQMEIGWTRRGSSGSTRRTLEVWAFAIYFIFRYVSRIHFPYCSLSNLAYVSSVTCKSIKEGGSGRVFQS